MVSEAHDALMLSYANAYKQAKLKVDAFVEEQNLANLEFDRVLREITMVATDGLFAVEFDMSTYKYHKTWKPRLLARGFRVRKLTRSKGIFLEKYYYHYLVVSWDKEYTGLTSLVLSLRGQIL